MRRSFVPVAVSALLLGACSPAQYKVNPPSPEKVQEAVPESQQAGYMRILGDLRWDELTSKGEWMKRFPECLRDYPDLDYMKINYITNRFSEGNRRYCKDFVAGGIHLSPEVVFFAENMGTKSRSMTRSARFGFFDDSRSRAFKSAIAQKYPLTTSGYCSEFTCWEVGYVDRAGTVTAKPTPYAISILDNVKVDTSDI